MARLGTSLNIGKDLGKKEPDIKVEELDPKEVDKTTQKSLKEPQKVKIEKYGEHTIPNAILKFLDTYGLAILLLLSVIAGIWSLQAPLQLNHVGDTVEEIFWRDLSSQSALKMNVDFPLLSPEEKSRLFDMEFKKIKKEPQILGKLDKFITDAKSLFIDNNGYVYLFNRDAYNYINAADKGEGSLGFLYTFIGPFTGQSIEHFAAVLTFILGILSIILMFFIGNLFGKYGGFFAAFLMAFHPSFIKFMHLGKFTNALVAIPLTLFVLFIVLTMVKQHLIMRNGALALLLVYAILIIKYFLAINVSGASIKEMISFFHIILIPFALVSIGYMIYSLMKYPKKDFQHLALLLFGLLLFIASFFAEQVLLVMLPVFILFVAFCLVRAIPVILYLLEQTQLGFQERTWTWVTVVIIGGVIFFGFLPTINAYTPNPSMNDALFCSANYMAVPDDIPVISWPDISQQLGFYSKQTPLITSLEQTSLFSKALLTNNETRAFEYIQQICEGVCSDKVHLVISSNYFKKLLLMLSDVNETGSIAVSKIKRCGKQGPNLVCANGYVLDDQLNITKGKKPSQVISYLNEKQNRTYEGQHSLILFKNNAGFYSFIIDDAYADAMIVRFLASDKFKHFKLKYRIEHPEQVFVYEVNTKQPLSFPLVSS